METFYLVSEPGGSIFPNSCLGDQFYLINTYQILTKHVVNSEKKSIQLPTTQCLDEDRFSAIMVCSGCSNRNK